MSAREAFPDRRGPPASRPSRAGAAWPSVGETLLSARSAYEYLAMFDLHLVELRSRRVLDCPGGAAAFTAACAQAGVAVVAVDPAYAAAHAALVARARADAARGSAYVRTHADRYAWTFFADPDAHDRARSTAVERFVEDVAVAPDRYVAGALPALPFHDGCFDLALSSHLLFTYDDRLDLTFHIAAMREMLRVSMEVRVFPLLGGGRTEGLLPALVAALRADGVDVSIRQVGYELQRGGNEMLTARIRSSPAMPRRRMRSWSPPP